MIATSFGAALFRLAFRLNRLGKVNKTFGLLLVLTEKSQPSLFKRLVVVMLVARMIQKYIHMQLHLIYLRVTTGTK